jgi:DNA-directed RNA polymerase subunit M/transcription elongation factor TFIIS
MSQKINGTIVLKEEIISAKFNVHFPANVKLNAYCDDKDRIFVESPNSNGVFTKVSPDNIKEHYWDEDTNVQNKPKFFQTVLQEIKGNVLEHVYTKQAAKLPTMTERMGSENAECPNCHKNSWWILPKESSSVREGGKAYIECLNCGYQTHL